jgi:oligopeptide transport system substrate-binding protein
MARRTGRGGRWLPALAMLLALATALLAGCSAPSLPPLPWQAHSPAPLPDAQQILRISAREGRPTEPLDPAALNDLRSDVAQITPLLYSGLFSFDARLRPVPALAASYAVSADGLRYTFHLRTGTRFAEGTPITSSDVAFSLQRLLDPCVGSAYSFVFFSLLGALPYATQQSCNPSSPALPPPLPPLIGHALLTPDPDTLVIVLAQPDAALLAKLAEPYSGVVEQAVVRRYGANWTSHLADGSGQGTSGMYRLASVQGMVNEGTQLLLARASHYWGAPPRLREVIVRLYNPTIEPPPAGDLIFDSGSPPEFSVYDNRRIDLSKLPGFHQTLARDEDYLLLSPSDAGLSDVRARQALALALNKPTLAALIGGAATNHLIPPGTGAYPAALSGPIATAPLTGDVAQARALWQSYVQAKCGGAAIHCPDITLWVWTSDLGSPTPFDQNFAHTVAAQWQAALAGVKVKIAVRGGGLLQTIPMPEYSGYFNWDEDFVDPQDWIVNLSGSVGAPEPTLNDPAAAALVKQAEATLNPSARLALYQQAENTLLNDAVVIPIAQEQDGWAIAPTVANFPATPDPYISPVTWVRIELTAPASK